MPNDKVKECKHEWGTDGQHSNEFCKKCFVSKPELTVMPPLYGRHGIKEKPIIRK
jgi:hypothetical protein